MNFADRIYGLLGKQIRAARQKSGLTQDELAQKVGLTRTSITNIEQGQQKIQIHTLYEMAHALNRSIVDFLPSLEVEQTSIANQLKEELRPDEYGQLSDIFSE